MYNFVEIYPYGSNPIYINLDRIFTFEIYERTLDSELHFTIEITTSNNTSTIYSFDSSIPIKVAEFNRIKQLLLSTVNSKKECNCEKNC